MSDRLRFSSKFSLSLLLCCLLTFISACNPPQRVSAEARMFRNLDLEFVANYDIPKTTFKDTVVGGLSAIAYNREQDLYYVLSDDRSMRSPARFYTFKLEIEQTDAGIKIASFQPEEVTLLRDETGQEFPQGAIDPEGFAISPRNTIFISSEGNPTQGVEPFIAEFDPKTGTKLANLRIPERYLASEQAPDQGIQENLAFESLTINRTGLPEDPFRVFTATESALIQDESYAGEEQARVRLLHYIVNPVGKPVLLAEHLYLLEPAPADIIANGLTELLALPTEGYFLSLERTFGFAGAGAKIFQVVIGNATDTTNIASLQGNITQVQPLRKKLLLDLADLGIYLDNLEGMTIGPRLPDGSRSLLLISDDNFNDEQVSQLLLFRLLEN
ncbi:MAG: esterase-like activity of phytase family protein [Cyanobacteria bacterium P01_G01_bin.39]